MTSDITVGRSFPAFLNESTKMEPILGSAQVLKQEAEKLGYESKDIAEYVKQHQALDREDRAAWKKPLDGRTTSRS